VEAKKFFPSAAAGGAYSTSSDSRSGLREGQIGKGGNGRRMSGRKGEEMEQRKGTEVVEVWTVIANSLCKRNCVTDLT